jgi:hypothetical protein
VITPEPGKAARLPITDEISNASSSNDTQEKPHKNEKQKNTKTTTYLDVTMASCDDAKPDAKPSKKKALKKPIFKNIRYWGIIDTPPSKKPFEEFVELLKPYLTTVQLILGKDLYLAPWDSEQEATFPHLKLPSDVPDSQESLGIYLGTYINLKQDSSKIYMNLRWIAATDCSGPLVPLKRFGMELADTLPKLKISMQKQPLPCQSVKLACIGWFMYSSKHINSKTFAAETRASPAIPQEVAIGISYIVLLTTSMVRNPHSTATTHQLLPFTWILINGTTWYSIPKRLLFGGKTRRNVFPMAYNSASFPASRHLSENPWRMI